MSSTMIIKVVFLTNNC